MGGAGDSCWSCGEEHWVDRRLLGGGGGGGGKPLVDLEGWNGMDSAAEVENPSRRARLEFLASDRHLYAGLISGSIDMREKYSESFFS